MGFAIAPTVLGGTAGRCFGGGEAAEGILALLRDGNGGAGRALVDAGSASVDGVGDDGPEFRSSGRAPGILPTLFGGGAKVLTSLVWIVAKYRGTPLSCSSSFFPVNGTKASAHNKECEWNLFPLHCLFLSVDS